MGDYFALAPYWKTVRFIKGEYNQQVFDEHRGEITTDTLPYIEIFQHWQPLGGPKKGRSHLCSAGLNEFDPEPCVGCSMDFRRSVNRVFTVVHLAHYHKTPLTDRDTGEIVRRKTDGTTVMIDRECEGKGCPMCASGDEKFFGKRKHLKMGLTHFGQLVSKVDDLNAACQCGGEIVNVKFVCPTCEKLLIDLDDEDCEMTENQVWQAKEQGHYCDNCGYNVDILPIPECEKCEDPRPVSLFDVNVSLRKVDVSGGRGTSLDVKFSEACGVPEEYEGPVEPLDLQSIFTPKPIPDQRQDYKYQGEITNIKSKETESYE